MDNIDRDLFGRNVRGAMYQPVDETLDKYKKASYNLVRAAYAENVVRALCLLCAYLEACNRLRVCLSGRARHQISLPLVTSMTAVSRSGRWRLQSRCRTRS